MFNVSLLNFFVLGFGLFLKDGERKNRKERTTKTEIVGEGWRSCHLYEILFSVQLLHHKPFYLVKFTSMYKNNARKIPFAINLSYPPTISPKKKKGRLITYSVWKNSSRSNHPPPLFQYKK